tara:strand:- start:31 stop:249 length:219 start_codon:yes stop_codon:yes gene_type:complete
MKPDEDSIKLRLLLAALPIDPETKLSDIQLGDFIQCVIKAVDFKMLQIGQEIAQAALSVDFMDDDDDGKSYH